MRQKLYRQNGFTLVEVMITVGMLAVVLTGLIRLFIFCSYLSELSGNITLVMSEAQNKIEKIRNHSFVQIATDYGSGGTPGNTFTVSGVNSRGVIYLNTTNANLYEIDVVICWIDKDGRVIGEDTNLNGVLDSGEDVNGNGKIDSQARITTLLARR